MEKVKEMDKNDDDRKIYFKSPISMKPIALMIMKTIMIIIMILIKMI